MNTSTQQKLLRRKRRIEKRLRPRSWHARRGPMFAARNIHYDLADRTRGLACGGIGAIHLLARQTGLIDALDQDLRLLKVHLPYHESDHVLNIAYNLLAGGDCLEDIERLRNDEVYLDALGASRIPDPTTAGDFCRRFQNQQQVIDLMGTINRVRLEVWKQQEQEEPEFFQQAILDADGTIAPTSGSCKEGMDLSYDGQWGYHPLVVSLANTKEPLYLVNRPGNRPSHEQAAEYLDRGIDLCRQAGFKKVLMRGDTDFSQTQHLDRWDGQTDVQFLFGLNNIAVLRKRATNLPEGAWARLERPEKYQVKTQERQRPQNVKERLVAERNFKNLVARWEDVAEFEYRPVACKKAYRVVVLRKRLEVRRGERWLWDDYRYFFFITNVRDLDACELVLLANDRADQENLIAQLKGGLKAMKMPTGDLISNWAYMVMASLAWTLKAWMGLSQPVSVGRWKQRDLQRRRTLVAMEFKTFLGAVMRLPCQIVRTGRRIVYRLLSFGPWTEVLLRSARAWRPLRC